MDAESRQTALEAHAEIMWVYQGIRDTEIEVIETQEGQLSRLINTRQGSSKYLVHAMFFCETPHNPVTQCGREGDIWISEPNIYYKTSTGWNATTVDTATAPKHPFLDRYLTLHPAHCAMQWIEKSSIRQHWNKGKWTREAIEKLGHPGIRNVAQREDVRRIIGIPNTQISSAKLSHYLVAILPLFLDNDVEDDAVPETQPQAGA